MNKILTFILFLIFFKEVFSQEQNLKFEKISIESGLSQSAIYSILQDSHGFMWFGTEDGLNLYDGYSFKVFKHMPNNPSSLSNNEIYSLHEDRSGKLWIGTQAGLNLMDRSSGTFTQFKNEPDNQESLSSDAVWTIHESLSEEGILWIGTINGGLNRFDTKTGKFKRFRHNPNNTNSLSSDIVLVVYESEEAPGILWIGTSRGGLNKLILTNAENKGEKENNISSSQFSHYKNNPKNPLSLSNNTVWSIHESLREPGIMWIGTWAED